MASTPSASSGNGKSDIVLMHTNERAALLGHDFSRRELLDIGEQMVERNPLLTDWSVFFVSLVIRGIYTAQSAANGRPLRPVAVIEPLLQTMLKGGSGGAVIPLPTFDDIVDTESAYNRTTNTMRRLLENRIVEDKLIPLHADTHWSLLHYQAHTARWYHYDSCGTYHTDYAMSFFQYLYRENIIAEPELQHAVLALLRDSTALYKAHLPPQQRGGWECGFYVLMYIRRIFKKDLEPLTVEDDAESNHAFLTAFRNMCSGWTSETLRHLMENPVKDKNASK